MNKYYIDKAKDLGYFITINDIGDRYMVIQLELNDDEFDTIEDLLFLFIMMDIDVFPCFTKIGDEYNLSLIILESVNMDIRTLTSIAGDVGAVRLINCDGFTVEALKPNSDLYTDKTLDIDTMNIEIESFEIIDIWR